MRAKIPRNPVDVVYEWPLRLGLVQARKIHYYIFVRCDHVRKKVAKSTKKSRVETPETEVYILFTRKMRKFLKTRLFYIKIDPGTSFFEVFNGNKNL